MANAYTCGPIQEIHKAIPESFFFFFDGYCNTAASEFEIHTASTSITLGTHTDGGAVIRKPG